MVETFNSCCISILTLACLIKLQKMFPAITIIFYAIPSILNADNGTFQSNSPGIATIAFVRLIFLIFPICGRAQLNFEKKETS